MVDAELHTLTMTIQIVTALITKYAGRDMEAQLAARGIPISSLQLGVMRTMHYARACTLSEISREMMLSPATLVPVVDALEHHGLARRRRDMRDRRRALLTLTENGEQTLKDSSGLTLESKLFRATQTMGVEKCRVLAGLLRETLGFISDDPTIAERIMDVVHSHFPPTESQGSAPETTSSQDPH